MKDYFISEVQLEKILKSLSENEVKTISTLDAVREVIYELKKEGMEAEDIMDILIQLRFKDPYTIIKMKNDYPELEVYLEKILEHNPN